MYIHAVSQLVVHASLLLINDPKFGCLVKLVLPTSPHCEGIFPRLRFRAHPPLNNVKVGTFILNLLSTPLVSVRSQHSCAAMSGE